MIYKFSYYHIYVQSNLRFAIAIAREEKRHRNATHRDVGRPMSLCSIFEQSDVGLASAADAARVADGRYVNCGDLDLDIWLVFVLC